ncbi:hypothetical protein PE066_08650 [Ramlibacter tataouinensis]|uniref:hypothetical protein n=1 Tax=Ramlibacter tataouinensis TaxID=94132 RepID=UPI0022F3A3F2|nr:hypothetical protein [Ramlibacter tataouinensis]WBY03585.1 hypothetical protein PE066_08650 [Ramlibacter tataouinensis]
MGTSVGIFLLVAVLWRLTSGGLVWRIQRAIEARRARRRIARQFGFTGSRWSKMDYLIFFGGVAGAAAGFWRGYDMGSAWVVVGPILGAWAGMFAAILLVPAAAAVLGLGFIGLLVWALYKMLSFGF